MRILFSTVGLTGHLGSLVPLAWACRLAGHQVVLATSPDAVGAVVATGLPALGVGHGTATGGAVGSREVADAPSSWDRGRLFGRSARDRLPGLRRAVRDWGPDVVVVERADLAGRVAAAETGLPCLELRWSVEAPREYEVAARRELRGVADPDALRSVPREVLTPWPHELRGGRVPAHRTREFRHVPYEGPGDLTDRIVPRADAGRDGGRVCVTLGTVVSRSEAAGRGAVVPTLVTALVRAGCEVVLAAPADAVAQWGPWPAAVRVAGPVPVSHLLETSDVVVHHGGHGTALAAALAGRPSVMMPAFDDQIGNARALAGAGAGVLAGDPDDPADVAATCLAVLDDAAMADAAAALADLVRSRPALPAVVEGVLGPQAASARTAFPPGSAAA
ncbi:glycosyltransferase [Actinomycetospora aeridis]|uniref:Nucleotide disphospho-sugar-binding domain-containing protein n=1 Tax=Actinomycetospora aeridis TaxID=3129231 RepID=A0ABU8N097_9PSEU